MARVTGFWKKIGDTIQPVFTGGVNLLISGANRYLNFNSGTGEDGYGIRDNNGTLQFKNSAGSWQDFGFGGAVDSVNGQTGVVNLAISDLIDVTKSATAPINPQVGDLWIDLS